MKLEYLDVHLGVLLKGYFEILGNLKHFFGFCVVYTSAKSRAIHKGIQFVLFSLLFHLNLFPFPLF